MESIRGRSALRQRLYRIIFEHDTTAGRAFDVFVIVAILVSVVVVMLDSVATLAARYRTVFWAAEWFFTILFTIEYALRLYSAPSAWRYARSFYGVIDLLSVLPTYLSVFFPAGRFLLTFRILRVLRAFRVLRLVHFLGEAGLLSRALMASRFKITVFLAAVGAVVVVVGSLMYVIEGAEAGFTSIPISIYWAIVTMTTVGYGDIAPVTTLGRFLAALLMITGFGILAVPTGIVSVELGRVSAQDDAAARTCRRCGESRHQADARFCRRCAERLPPR